jgi:hypothetical protein
MTLPVLAAAMLSALPAQAEAGKPGARPLAAPKKAKASQRAAERRVARAVGSRPRVSCRGGRAQRWRCSWVARSGGCRGRYDVTRRRGRWRVRRAGTTCPRPAAPAQPTAPPAPAPPAARPFLFGFNDNSVRQGLTTPAAAADLAAGAGANATRLTVDWRWAEPAPGDLRLASYDAIYDALVARGITPVLIPLFAPSWALDGACNQWAADCRFPPAPAHVDEYAEFAAHLARRYPRAAIEVWNEPNQTYFWRPGPDPARYAGLLKATYAAVKAASPSTTVVSGGLADNPDTSAGIPPKPFAAAMYEHGASGSMDAFAFHAYTHVDGLFERTIADMRALHAGRDVPFWITESGVTTSGAQSGWPLAWIADPPRQAADLVATLRRVTAMPDVEALILHALVEPPGDPLLSPGVGYGVVTRALSPKPAYCAIARERRAGNRRC